MKKIFFVISIMFFEVNSFAQPPQIMSYQAVIRNSSDQLVTNHVIGMRISILQGSATGTPVYVETQSPNSNANGLVTIGIGGGTQITGTFAGVEWSTGSYFIKTEIDPSGGTNYIITGTSQLMSVPYAFNAKSVTGTINANNSIISNVSTPINNTDAANKAYVDAMQTQILMLKNTIRAGGIVSDIEGNLYNTVVIGTQTWMAENLKTTKYNDGSSIPLLADSLTWTFSTSPGYCWYNNNENEYKTTYGALYNLYSINTGKLCPIGWHVSTKVEWETLMTYLGGSNFAGGKLKEIGTTHWISPNYGATNESGFTGLPGGSRTITVSSSGNSSKFSGLGTFGSWWGITTTSGREVFSLLNDEGLVFYSRPWLSYSPSNGFSVRCIKE
jgi:uncharacterized protein (TIGR02145 family)